VQQKNGASVMEKQIIFKRMKKGEKEINK